jgi:cytidylate kinase
MSNDNLILISGPSATGKSASLMNLADPAGVMYLNTEANKKLPFKSNFQEYNIVHPDQVIEACIHAETDPSIHTIVIDSLTFLLDQYETINIVDSKDGMKAWANFQQYFKRLMQQYVASSTKNFIFTAHTQSVLNESEMVMEVKVPVKGALKSNGLESYFSTVISTKKVPIKTLDKYKSPLLNITAEEAALGFKYCFQTKITKDTLFERMRGPMGLFTEQDTFTDNNVQLILDQLHKFYN